MFFWSVHSVQHTAILQYVLHRTDTLLYVFVPFLSLGFLLLTKGYYTQETGNPRSGQLGVT